MMEFLEIETLRLFLIIENRGLNENVEKILFRIVYDEHARCLPSVNYR